MARESRYYQVTCPQCGNDGRARISENDGWRFMNRGPERTVTAPEGFVLVDQEEMVFHCKECGGVADIGR